MLTEKVYIGLDNAPTAFDIRSRILGQGGTNLEYIRSETGVVAILKGGLSDKFEPLHLSLHHARQESLAAARSLAHNLIETVRAELAQWSAAHASVPPPTLNVPPPTTPSNALGQPPPNVANPTPTVNTSIPVTSAMSSIPQQATLTSIVSVPSSSTPLMTVRQPTVLQLFPQQQYVLNQENGQLIPIVQSPIQMAGPGSGITNLTALPISQSLNSIQQPLGTQILDISSMQPVNVTPLRINNIPGTMPMFVQNGLTFHQVSSGNVPEVTSVTSTVVPIVSASTAQGSNKIAWNLDKDKQLSGDTIQWTVPSSQTMLIPYQNIQEFTSQAGLPNLQAAQQIISMGGAGMAWAGGAAQMHTPLAPTAMHTIHPHNPNILHINPKLSANNTSFINIISSGSQNGVTIPSQGQMIATGTSNPSKQTQESRGQKRQSDGSPSQMQLRPIAPAGSQVERGSSLREVRAHAVYTHNQGRESNFSGSPQMMTVKVNTSLGGVQTQTISSSGPGGNQDPSKGDKVLVSSAKDINKVNEPKIISGSNVQMILPQGMTVLPNQIGQIPSSLGQGQIYMIPASQANLHSGNIQQNLVPQQVIPQGNITMMQYPQSQMQYNTVPLMQVVPPGAQFISNPQVSHHLLPNQSSTSQANSTNLPNISTAQIIPISQGQTLQYIQNLQANDLGQNSPYVLGNQFSNTHQYVMQSNGNMPAQYNVPPQTAQENDSSQTIQSENGQTASSANGQGFVESVNGQGYPAPPAQPAVSAPQQVTALPYQPNQLPPAPNIPPPSGNYPAPNIQTQNSQVYSASNTSSPQPSQINFGQSQGYQGQGQAFSNGQSYQPVGDGQGNGYVGAGQGVQYGAPGPAPAPVPGGPGGQGVPAGAGGPGGAPAQYGAGGGSRPWFRAPPPGYTAPPPPVPQAPLAPPQGTYTYWQEPQPNV